MSGEFRLPVEPYVACPDCSAEVSETATTGETGPVRIVMIAHEATCPWLRGTTEAMGADPFAVCTTAGVVVHGTRRRPENRDSGDR